MEYKKEFFETTFPDKLQKFQSILKDRNEGKGFFLGDKVRDRKTERWGELLVVFVFKSVSV